VGAQAPVIASKRGGTVRKRKGIEGKVKFTTLSRGGTGTEMGVRDTLTSPGEKGFNLVAMTGAIEKM